MGGITGYGGSGSPLLSRQSGVPYMAIIVALFVIAILFAVWILFRLQKKYTTSRAYIEKQKNRITKFSDVRALAKKINLSRAETNLLFSICKKEQIKNIRYYWTDDALIDRIFGNEYSRMRLGGVSEEEIFNLFRLRTRIEKILSIAKAISSSHSIPAGEEVSFQTEEKRKFNFEVLQNQKDALILKVPENFEGTLACPAPLAKIIMTYLSPQKNQYVLSTRIIRFQNGANGVREMLVQHSTAVSMQNRRLYKRANTSQSCTFRGVEETTGKRGEVMYAPKDNLYKGALLDISAGGCKLQTKLAIKRNQKIWLEIELPGCKKIEACGLIVGAKRDGADNGFDLHISFIYISARDRNEIFAFVYRYAA